MKSVLGSVQRQRIDGLSVLPILKSLGLPAFRDACVHVLCPNLISSHFDLRMVRQERVAGSELPLSGSRFSFGLILLKQQFIRNYLEFLAGRVGRAIWLVFRPGDGLSCRILPGHYSSLEYELVRAVL